MRVEAHVHIGRARRGLSDCISVRTLPGGLTRHSGFLSITDATFAVQPAGRRKAVESGVKNVHAFVRGTRLREFPEGIDDHDFILSVGYREAGYTPAVGYFFDKISGEKITKSKVAILIGKRLYYR